MTQFQEHAGQIAKILFVAIMFATSRRIAITVGEIALTVVNLPLALAMQSVTMEMPVTEQKPAMLF